MFHTACWIRSGLLLLAVCTAACTDSKNGSPPKPAPDHDGGAAGAADSTSSGGGAGAPLLGSAGDGGETGGAGGGAGEEMPTEGLTARPPNGDCRVTWSDPRSPPALLSETGCVDADDPLKPAAALIPFTVTSPLWSDGAEKERYLLLPDDQQIVVKDCEATPDECPESCTPGLPCEMEGEFQFPVGTILIKNFSLSAQRIETRLLVRFSDAEWLGHSYQWRQDQTDADLVDRLGADVVYDVEGTQQTWHYPSAAECMQCHTTAAGVTLGPETLQLNGDFTYPNGVTANQLTTLEAIDLFTSPLPERLKAVTLAGYADDAAGLDARARSYLHANCAQCHRPGSNKPTVDFRFTASLAATGACNADTTVQDGTLGIVGAKIIAPGAHAQSLVWARMDTLEPTLRMPQLASSVRDDLGAALVADWIDSLQVPDCAE